MRRVNGIIVEATREELQELYKVSNWCNTADYKTFEKLMVDEGCQIITNTNSKMEEQGKCEKQIIEPQCSDSVAVPIVANVQQETSVPKKTVTVKQSSTIPVLVSVDKGRTVQTVTGAKSTTNVLTTPTSVMKKNTNTVKK